MSAPRIWPDSTVVCIASGPSLTQADVEAVRGRARVIVVNDGVRLAPWSDVLYSSDRGWWKHYQGMPSFAGLKFAIGNARGQANAMKDYPDIQVLAYTGDTGIEPSPAGLKSGKNSGAAAINLAVHLGASRILLLGYDMGRDGKRTHFFGRHPDQLNDFSNYHKFCWFFDHMAIPLRERGVTVINCSRATALRSFPRQSLSEALGRVEVAA